MSDAHHSLHGSLPGEFCWCPHFGLPWTQVWRRQWMGRAVPCREKRILTRRRPRRLLRTLFSVILSSDRPRDPCRVCRFLRVPFFPVACSPRSTWPSDALARPSMVHFADGEATTCFLSVHQCPPSGHSFRGSTKVGSAVRLCVDSLRRRLTRAEGATAEQRCELDRLLFPFLLNDVSPWMIRTHSCLSFVVLPHNMWKCT